MPAGGERSRPATSPAFRCTTGPSPSCAWRQGNGTTPLAEAQAGLGLVEETPRSRSETCSPTRSAPTSRFTEASSSAAQAAVDEARRRLVAGPLEIGFEWMSWIDALLLEAQGRPAEALAVLEETWDLIAPVRYLQATSRAMGPDLVRMALAAGDHQRAVGRHRGTRAQRARAADTLTARGLALRCRGLLEERP